MYAGARIRCLTPIRSLRKRGVAVELFDARNIAQYRVVIIQGLRCYGAAGDNHRGPGLMPLVEQLRGQGCTIAVEDCDNHFYNPRELPEWQETARRLRGLIQAADHLIASTEAVAAVFRSETGTTLPITVIGDAVETVHEQNFEPAWRRWMSRGRKIDWLRYVQFRRAMHEDRIFGRRPLVWYGSHGSQYADGGMVDLLRIEPVLHEVSRMFPISLTIISNSRERYEQVSPLLRIPTRYLEWNRTTFLRALAAHEIALIPIHRTPFTVCKSNNRLLLALSCGLAVCADSIPSYLPFRHFCELDNWESGLVEYLRNPSRRTSHVREARQAIDSSWTTAAVADRWQELLGVLASSDENPHSNGRA